MTALLEKNAKLCVLRIEGTLRAPVRGELSQRVQALVKRGERRFLLDLARLSDMDAAGVGELARAYSTTAAAGGDLQIAEASRHVRQLLYVAGLWKLLSARAEAWPDRSSHAARNVVTDRFFHGPPRIAFSFDTGGRFPKMR